jgi:hypothetical protein
MRKEFVTFVLVLLSALGIVSIGLSCLVIWHGEIVLGALKVLAALIPAAAGITILLACLRCLPDLWKKIEPKTDKAKGAYL